MATAYGPPREAHRTPVPPRTPGPAPPQLGVTEAPRAHTSGPQVPIASWAPVTTGPRRDRTTRSPQAIRG